MNIEALGLDDDHVILRFVDCDHKITPMLLADHPTSSLFVLMNTNYFQCDEVHGTRVYKLNRSGKTFRYVINYLCKMPACTWIPVDQNECSCLLSDADYYGFNELKHCIFARLLRFEPSRGYYETRVFEKTCGKGGMPISWGRFDANEFYLKKFKVQFKHGGAVFTISINGVQWFSYKSDEAEHNYRTHTFDVPVRIHKISFDCQEPHHVSITGYLVKDPEVVAAGA